MSNAYIYQADVYCESCGQAIAEDLRAQGLEPADPTDEATFDSDDYPKGLFADDEADSPQHCGGCGVFLENPLTSDGYAYLLESVIEALRAGRTDSVVVAQWAPHYWEFEPAEAEPYFDRFDVCEAMNALAHDFGLYALKTRLDRAGFRSSPMRETFEDLSDNAKALYLTYALRVRDTGAYDPRPWRPS